MQGDIQTIIKDSVCAPSGENCQPWKFIVEGDKVLLWNIPEADQSLYNSQQKGSYIAHGALLENMNISAAHHGYTLKINLFPEVSTPDLVASIIYTQGVATPQPLYGAITTRATNRKDYSGKRLSKEEKEALISASGEITGGVLMLIDNDDDCTKLGRALAVNEKVLFENRLLHDFFYDHIIWDKKDEDKAGGFYIETLEFLPKQLKGVKLFKNWGILSLLNRVLGIATMISKENGEKYAQSGTFGMVTVNGNTPTDFINVGRSMQRVWLTGESLGIAMHPCNGIVYFVEQINDGGGAYFSKKHTGMIIRAYTEIKEVFCLNQPVASMTFRIGFAEKPTAVAKRLPPMITYNNQA
jgi:nitroreductase